MVRSKKYLRCLRDNGDSLEFIEYLIRQNSIVVNEYARRFCLKKKLKPVEISDQDYLERSIKIAKVKWLDNDL